MHYGVDGRFKAISFITTSTDRRIMFLSSFVSTGYVFYLVE